MTTHVDAIYEHGTLRLLQDVGLDEGERVKVSIVSEMASGNGESPNVIFEQISALAVSRTDDHFSGENHDDILYGKRESS
jgi:predicted DNA-binding antitoxin AbrB/MazE fold protein